MAIKSRRKGAAPRATKPKATPALAHTARRARFVAEYLLDHNATQAAIRAGYSPKTAKQQGSRLLTDADVVNAIAAKQQKVNAKLADRYEVTADRITRELALLGFSNMGDYGRVDHEGEFRIDLTATDRDAMAAIQGVKTRRSVRTHGEFETETITTEIKLSDKRAALVDLGKITGLFKDGPDITIPVRFIISRPDLPLDDAA